MYKHKFNKNHINFFSLSLVILAILTFGTFTSSVSADSLSNSSSSTAPTTSSSSTTPTTSSSSTTPTTSSSTHISWDQLSTYEQNIYLADGFTKNDTYYRSTVTLPTQNTNSIFSTSLFRSSGMNVVNMTGSTKKASSTTAKTRYILTSGRSLLKTHVRLQLGNTSRYFYSDRTPKALAYSSSITSRYSGRKNYFTMHLTCQYYTSLGKGSLGCTAGGCTLGK